MITIQEVEEKLKTMNDFLKMEYLESLSKKQNPIEVGKYVRKQISRLYADKGMYSNSAKQLEAWADMAVTFKEKIEAYILEVEMWIRAGEYNNADDIIKRALANATLTEKTIIKERIKQSYINQALMLERRNERNKALKIYERLYSTETDVNKKEDIRKKLLDLYEKTGKVREYMMFKK
jgi:Arc/MetJ-type ribon-helix-helix transcriptional regulator